MGENKRESSHLMARLRKNDTGINTASPAAAAAPARRPAAAPRRRAGTNKSDDLTQQSEDVMNLADGPAAEPVAVRAFSSIEYTLAHDEVSALAYSYWVERGYTEGSPEQDWLRAEEELRRRAR
jgi:Protein of unknown function (DUF2934)